MYPIAMLRVIIVVNDNVSIKCNFISYFVPSYQEQYDIALTKYSQPHSCVIHSNFKEHLKKHSNDLTAYVKSVAFANKI